MREPTFSRSRRRARQQRLLRTGAGVVVLIGIAAVAVSLLGGGDAADDLPTPDVSFAATFTGYGEKDPAKPQVDEQGEAIVALLDGWYQRAFVNVEDFGDGTFPEVAALFDEAARTSFTEDIDALTIGEAAEEVARVEPDEATAAISIYFEDGAEPVYATAKVAFTATASMKDDSALPLKIDQEVTLFLTHADGTWLVSTWYDATQRQDSVQATPSPGASS